MRNIKEVQAILTAIFCLNRTSERNEQIDRVCDYAFRRLFGANTNLLSLACLGQTKEAMEQQIKYLLEQETEFKKYGGIQIMESFKTQAYINSLNEGLIKPTNKDEITVLEKVGDNDYIVDYKGVKCHALFNWFICAYFADDVYRRVG